MNSLAKFLRGEYFSKAVWKAIAVVGVSFFIMVYMSASMDQKVYKIRSLKSQKDALSTHYVELQSEISQVRMKSGDLEYFQSQGFEISQDAAYKITIKKQ
ncbi:MAG: hypothetical protein IJ483_05580 [Flavobacteriales bacterium]|nr:hypothetical protein [Flavobacteriales bacterium]MBQ8650687.1 hypothetical protein [Flavobacteriales bacterium]